MGPVRRTQLEERLILTRTSRLLAALLAVALCATLASSALAADGSSVAAKKKVSLKIKGKSQKDILKKGVKVQVKGKKAKKLKLKVASKTFDDSKFKSLGKTKKVKLNKKGKATVSLKLSGDGKSQVKTCQGRTIQVTAKGAKSKVKLVRDTSKCKPQKIDLSRADECDFIGDQDSSRCLLPFPDDYYTTNDPDTATGKRLNISTGATPTNSSDVPIDGTPYSQSDGFSPGQAIVVRIPGLDNPDALAATDATPLADLGRYTEEDAPVVVIDADTGERHPIWVEIDSNANDVARADDGARSSGGELRLRASLHHRDAQPQRQRRRDAERTGGVPLLPRRPALEQVAYQRSARPLRQHLRLAEGRRREARRPLSRMGLHRRHRREHRQEHARDAQRRVRSAR